MNKPLDWSRLASVSICIALWGAGAYLAIRYALSLFLPFLLALCISAVTVPLARRLSDKIKLPRKVLSVTLTFLLLTLVVFLIAAGIDRLLSELRRLVAWLEAESVDADGSVSRFFEWFRTIGDRIPLLGRLKNIKEFRTVFENLDELLSDLLSGMVGQISAQIPVLAGNLAAAMPSVFLFAVTFVLSCFYIAADDGRLSRAICGRLPEPVRTRLAEWRPRLRDTVLRYLRAYLLLMAITFGELFIGLSILGAEYAFLLALLTAVVDLLPVFGTGTVLIPWAVFRFLAEDFRTGFGLLILYGVVLLIRQIIEPHIVGGSLGLHPLATLIAMYVGYRLCGFTGLIFGPVAALMLRTVLFPQKGTEGSKPTSANSLQKG